MTDLKSQKLVRQATYASVSVALVLICVKFVAWWVTGAMSLLATLLDSVLDMIASLIIFLAVYKSQQPASRAFRFGYGKAEAVASLIQSGLISVSVLWLLWEAGERLLHPQPLESITTGVIAIVITMFLTTLLLFFQRYVIRRTQSVAIRADSAHYQADLLMNGGILVTLFLIHITATPWIDSIVAIVVTISIVFPLWKVTLDALAILMDRELAQDIREDIKRIATSHPAVQGMHDLRTRASGTRHFIQLHLELDGEMNLHTAHQICAEVEKEILKVYPHSEILIHQDPVGVIEKRDTFVTQP